MKALHFCLVASCAAAAIGAVACSRQSGSGVGERWDNANSPFLFSRNYERRFDALPKQGSLPEAPWSDTYWPSSEGGIAARWQTWDNGFDYAVLTPQEVLNTATNLSKLSPAEKYDIFAKSYDFPTVQSERKRVSPTNEGWEGLCHGWAPASLLFREPNPVTVRNADGLNVAFGSSDVKALLTYYIAVKANSRTRYLGQRCNENMGEAPHNGSLPECKDVNAGSFHLVLVNQIALMKEGFVADVTRDLQVWNQPVHGFRSRILGTQGPSAGAAPGTVREVLIETDMIYGVETGASWEKSQESSSKTYQYRVELDAQGLVIGGEWISEDRPDFLWSSDKPAFEGYYKGIEKIYNASVSPQPTPVVTPTPVPTPVVTPTPVRTPVVTPTPVRTPVVTPTPVRTPVVTPTPVPTPVVTPTPSRELFCPQGSALLPVGTEGGLVCASREEAFGPFNTSLIHKCQQAGGGRACHADRWSLSFYLSLRGSGSCPEGSRRNGEGYCEEGRHVVGPFTRAHVERCQALGYVYRDCESSRWETEMARAIFSAR